MSQTSSQPPVTAPTPRGEVLDQAEHEAEIVLAIQSRFRTFGGGDVRSSDNPIAHALKDQPAQFAAGVDVAQIVRFVLTAHYAFLGVNSDDRAA